MKKIILTLTALSFVTSAYCQTLEYSLRLNSGLFSFSGKSAQALTKINYDIEDNDGYTNNPYGSKTGLCYGISGNLSRISKRKFLIGVDMGYELLRSKIDINGVWEYDGNTNSIVNAEGQTYLNYSFVNLFPYFGYRFNISKINFDISGGFDFAYCLQTTEKGNASTPYRTYKTKRDRNTINTEIRARIQVDICYRKIGVYAGYSKGSRNYKSGYIGGESEAYGNLYRFGIKYKLNK